MSLFSNFPLWSAFIAIIVAQVVKVPIVFIATRQLDWRLVFSTGGMPSSHSAAVAALTSAIGLTEGFGSPYFAISAIFAVIVMFDATGVRRHAGEQAIVLNRLVEDFGRFVNEAKMWPEQEKKEKEEKLKELLGHQPIEVFFGALTGILISCFFYLFVYG